MENKNDENKSESNTNSNITYNGSVVIEYQNKKVKKSLKTHNEGKNPLFSCLTRALAGDLSNLTDYLPNYIMGYYSEVQFRFLVPQSSVLTSTINILRLLNRVDDTNYCAEVVLDTPITEANTGNLVVYWTMSFNNSQGE